MDRRTFIKQSCGACMAVGGMSLMSTLLSSCSSINVYKTTIQTNTIEIPVSELLPEENSKIIRTDAKHRDILLVRKPDNTFHALLMQCTHFDNALVANKKGLICNMHGSGFTFDGAVKNGPASRALKKFPVTIQNEKFIIQLS